jgi:hypothetical protein
MLRTLTKSAEHRDALARVREWTRARFGLGADDSILVAEVTCGLPGCPPRETVVAFWTADATRHHFKVFKEVADVVESDLPPSFMKEALADSDEIGCSCC